MLSLEEITTNNVVEKAVIRIQYNVTAARLSLLYKMQHGLVDVAFTRYLKLGDGRTRDCGFFQERIYSEVYYNLFFPHTSGEWNELPDHVTAATSVEEFRASLARRQVHV